ncbi:hypothetical protein ABW21_db0209923 [Orbilia brochopaga]|nr:hypothetical protein ABW21_db0209923 [Drechslerella brochopaga]
MVHNGAGVEGTGILGLCELLRSSEVKEGGAKIAVIAVGVAGALADKGGVGASRHLHDAEGTALSGGGRSGGGISTRELGDEEESGGGELHFDGFEKRLLFEESCIEGNVLMWIEGCLMNCCEDDDLNENETGGDWTILYRPFDSRLLSRS